MPRRKTDAEFTEEVYELVGDEYVFLEKYINSKTKILCRHNKCGNEWKISPNNFLRGKGCPSCANRTKKSNKVFLKEVYKQVNDEYSFLEEYINNKTSLLCRHNKCSHEWKIAPDNFLNKKQRCPKCAGNLKKTDNRFKEQVYKEVGSEYVFLEKYINNATPILCIHNKCGFRWKVAPNNFLNGTRCPNCNDFSKGELKIKKTLEKYNINIISEFGFENLKAKTNLRFDFAVFKRDRLVFLIEYDGRQHFVPNNHFDGYRGYRLRKVRDRMKSYYCVENNIPLLRIPYFKKHLLEDLITKELKRFGLLETG